MKTIPLLLTGCLLCSYTSAARALNTVPGGHASDPVAAPSPEGIVDDSLPGWTWAVDKEIADPMLRGGSAHALPAGYGGTYTFTGTGVDVYTIKEPAVTVDDRVHKIGELSISIDGKLQAVVSEYSQSTTYGYTIFAIAGLPQGNHVLQVGALKGWGILDYVQVRSSIPRTTPADGDANNGSPVHPSGTVLQWAGYPWNVNLDKSIGTGLVSGGRDTVFLDSRGHLHMAMNNVDGVWRGAELSTGGDFQFGSFYWVISGPLGLLESQDVLSGSLYGPYHGNGVDGSNEIAIEFSAWGSTGSASNGQFDIFPCPGTSKATDSTSSWAWKQGSVATCRIDWSPTSVTESLWPGVVPPNAATTTAAITGTYNGSRGAIPQSPCPFLFNLWAFKTAPSQAVEFTVETFQYIPMPQGQNE